MRIKVFGNSEPDQFTPNQRKMIEISRILDGSYRI